MLSLLSYRNWSLLIVVPAIGFLVMIINYPIWYAVFGDEVCSTYRGLLRL